VSDLEHLFLDLNLSLKRVDFSVAEILLADMIARDARPGHHSQPLEILVAEQLLLGCLEERERIQLTQD
jgi:hypothetical protein